MGPGGRPPYKGMYHCTFKNVLANLEGYDKEMEVVRSKEMKLYLQLVPQFLYLLKR